MALDHVYTGANGTLLLDQDPTKSKPDGADAKKILDAYTIASGTPLGRVTGVEIHVNTHLQGYYEIGARHPVSLHPENIYISGKVNRAYINGALIFLLLGQGVNPTAKKEPYPQPSLLMNVVLNDTSQPDSHSVISLTGVKFENWAFSIPEDDFVMENVTFKALAISVQDLDPKLKDIFA
jgi:hypothetical protein